MQTESAGNTITGITNNKNYISFSNPFTPPPIDDKYITKITKDEYVPLEEFQPSLAPTVFSQEEHCINLNYDEAALSIEPKNRRGRILNLSHWMVAWNAFIQAKLCYQPHLFYELYKYQEIICDFASRFIFEACYRYDISCRRKIAAERTIAPEKRTVNWTTVAREYENRHLTRSAMQSVCDNCQATGHIEILPGQESTKIVKEALLETAHRYVNMITMTNTVIRTIILFGMTLETLHPQARDQEVRRTRTYHATDTTAHYTVTDRDATTHTSVTSAEAITQAVDVMI